MKHFFKLVLILAPIALLAVTSTPADNSEKMVIALKTDNFETTEADISSLAIGESQTIETESGKLIDILRTNEGVEIYVDGELLDMTFNKEGLHEQHLFKKHIELACDAEEQCSKKVVVFAGNGGDAGDWEDVYGQYSLIHRSMSFSCTDDEELTDCSDNLIWVSEGEEFHFEDLHKLHAHDTAHKVIMIKKEVIDEN